MGFRSGDFEGHGSTGMPMFAGCLAVTRAVCGVAPSCSRVKCWFVVKRGMIAGVDHILNVPLYIEGTVQLYKISFFIIIYTVDKLDRRWSTLPVEVFVQIVEDPGCHAGPFFLSNGKKLFSKQS